MPLSAKPYLQSVTFRPDACFDAASYPFDIPAIRTLDKLELHPDVTFFVGENGAGKSTLLEAIAVAWGFSPEGGTGNFSLSTTAASTSALHEQLRLVRSYRKPRDGFFLRAESFYNVATYLEQVGGVLQHYGGKSLHDQSHGEAFLALLQSRFGGQGLYLLDEPEAALSPGRQLATLRIIDALVKKQSQFIIATHSPILLAYPGARILRFDGEGISQVAYEDTEHYAITRDFLNHYPRRLEQLLGDD